MIKKILPVFAVLIPLCILSFVAANVLEMFVGTNSSHGNNNNNSHAGSDSRNYTITDTTKTYNFDLEALDNITLLLAGVKAEIMASTDDKIHVMVRNANTERDAAVTLSAENGVSTVEVHPTNITFNKVGSGLISWLEDLFYNELKCSVWIMIPQKLYGDFNVKQGSGIVDINTIIANHNYFELGSGELSFTNNPLHRMLDLNLKLGSGKVKFKNADTRDYNFDIGSGEFDVSGLTGTGNVKMGSGNGTLSYKEYTGMVLEKGSGTLEMLLPQGTPIRVIPELGSGKIEVDLDGVSQIIKKSGEYHFGGENINNFLRVENGSGDIYIKNNSEYAPQNPDSSSVDNSGSSDIENSGSSDIENSGSSDIENSSNPETANSSNPETANPGTANSSNPETLNSGNSEVTEASQPNAA